MNQKPITLFSYLPLPQLNGRQGMGSPWRLQILLRLLSVHRQLGPIVISTCKQQQSLTVQEWQYVLFKNMVGFLSIWFQAASFSHVSIRKCIYPQDVHFIYTVFLALARSISIPWLIKYLELIKLDRCTPFVSVPWGLLTIWEYWLLSYLNLDLLYPHAS